MEGIDWGSLGLGGGIFGAIALVVVTLIKARSTDRQNILTQQSAHMDRLGKERNDAVTERDEAYKDAEDWRLKYEQEIRKRIEAETKAATADAMNLQMQTQIAELTDQVTQLRTEVARLTALATGGAS